MELQYTGGGISISEIVEVQIDRVIPGARYGVRGYNLPLMSTLGLPTDTTTTIRDRLIQAMQARAIQFDTLAGARRAVSLPGQTMGLRVDATPACYLEHLLVGVTPTAKQFRVTLPLGAAGGTWSLSFNFGAVVETLSGLTVSASASTLETGIDGLTTPAPGDAEVILEVPGNSVTPRSYLVTIGGTLAGTDFTVTANGALLTGNASVSIRTVQVPDGYSGAVLAFWMPALSPGNVGAPGHVRYRFHGATTGNWDRLTITSGKPYSVPITGPATSVVQCTSAKWYWGNASTLVVLTFEPGGDPGEVTLEVEESDDFNVGPYSYVNVYADEVRAAGANQNELVVIQSDLVDYTIDGPLGLLSIDFEVSNLDTVWSAATVHQHADPSASNAHRHSQYLVELDAANAATDVGAFTPTGGALVSVVVHGHAYQNEIQEIIVNADGGTFPLDYDHVDVVPSTDLAWNISAVNLNNALEAMFAVYGAAVNFTVTGSGTTASPFYVEFQGVLTGTNVLLLTADASNLTGGPDPTTTTITQPVPGQSPVDQLHLDPQADSGWITLFSAGDYSGQIAFDDNAANVETDLEQIAAVAAFGLTVVGDVGGPFLLNWSGWGTPPALEINQDRLHVSVSSLIRLVGRQRARGANHWDDPANWFAEQVPSSGDIPILQDGGLAIDEGLRQRSTWTRSGELLELAGGDFVVGQAIYLRKSAGGSFPSATVAGAAITLDEDTAYVVIGFDWWAQTCQLALTVDGLPIVLTSVGSGTFSVEVVLEEYRLYSTFSGAVGWSRLWNGMRQQRPRWLEIGAERVVLGLGSSGGGSALQNLDLGTTRCEVMQHGSGYGVTDGELATNLRFDNPLSPLRLHGGQAAVSPDDLDPRQSVLGAVEVRNATILFGHCEIGSYNGSGDLLSSSVGFTVAPGGTFVRRA